MRMGDVNSRNHGESRSSRQGCLQPTQDSKPELMGHKSLGSVILPPELWERIDARHLTITAEAVLDAIDAAGDPGP